MQELEEWPFPDWSPPAATDGPRYLNIGSAVQVVQMPSPPAELHFRIEYDARPILAAFAELEAHVREAWAHVADTVLTAHTELVRAGLVAPVPPAGAGVRERALYLRRHRNTGPPPPPLGRRHPHAPTCPPMTARR